MHVLGTRVPRRLGVARSASSPKAAQALGCSLTPGLQISFGRVSCMARAASVPGLWTLGFLLLCGVCVWVRVAVGCGFCEPRQSWLGSWAGVFGYGSWCCPSFAGCLSCSWLGFGFGLLMGRVWLRARSACPPPFPVLVCGAGVRAGVWVSAAPRPSLGGCWGVCVLVRPSRVVSCTSWSRLLCGVRVCARAPLVPRLSWLGCGVWACVLGLGLVCAPPFLVGLSGCVFCAFLLACLGLALWCRLLAVPVPGLVVPVPPSPFFRAGLLALLFFSSVVCFCMFWCPFSPWAAVPGLVLPVFAGWSPCASLGVLSSVPSRWGVWPTFVVLAGGPVAVGCSLAPPPPTFFSFLGSGQPVPPSAFPGLAHALARIQCGLPGCCWRLRSAWPCPGPMGRVGYVHVGLGAPSCRVGSWLCRLGGCARRLRVALG